MFTYLPSYSSATDVLGMEECLKMKGVPYWANSPLKDWKFLVLFGGEDISPWYYGERPVGTSAPALPSIRDKQEEMAVRECLDKGVPILGICRGAQLACCLLGGKLWQDVDHHNFHDHKLIIGDKEYVTNSYHHQMMRPSVEMEVIGYTPCLSPIKTAERPTKDESNEPEIVLHREKRVLMIQGHPEWQNDSNDLFVLTNQLVREYLL